MALHQIRKRGEELSEAMLAFGTAVDWLRTTYTSGEVPIRAIDAINESLFRSGQAAVIFLAEAQKNTAVAEDEVKSQQGYSETLAGFTQSVTEMHTVGGAWAQKVRAVIEGLDGPTLAGFQTITRNGASARVRMGLRALPETAGLELKNSAELADLRAALVQYGAITPAS